MNDEINDRSVNPLIRIANALEEILRLVKVDQAKTAERLKNMTKKSLSRIFLMTSPLRGVCNE